MRISVSYYQYHAEGVSCIFLILLIVVFFSNAAGVVLASNCDLDHCSLDSLSEYGNETPLLEDWCAISALPFTGFVFISYVQLFTSDFIFGIKHPPRMPA